MSNDQRKADIKSRITTLTDELTPLLAKVKNLQERIAHLELDLREVMDDRFQRREFQTKKFDAVRETR